MEYSILTPYLVPPHIAKRKKVNVGDGFILKRIEERLLPARAQWRFSIWEGLTAEAIERINSTKAVIIAGANQLQDDYMLTRGTSRAQFTEIKVPLIPFGVGISGYAERNAGPLPATRRALIEMHERIQYSSWRCPRTVEYIRQHIPEIADKALMTSCPVVYDEPILTQPVLPYRGGRIAVTVTDRGDFWERERAVLAFLEARFADAERVIVMHQAFDEPGSLTRARRLLTLSKLRSPGQLAAHARSRGFKIVTPASVEECWDIYRGCDMHIGSRLHAHLYFLSQAKPSYLVRVDDRSRGFAESLAFPDCDAVGIGAWSSVDFNRVRRRVVEHSLTMDRFVASCHAVLGVGAARAMKAAC